MQKNGEKPSLDIVKSTYQKILEKVDENNKENCKKTISYHLEKAQSALDEAYNNKEFANEIRSKALAFSGENFNVPRHEPHSTKQWH